MRHNSTFPLMTRLTEKSKQQASSRLNIWLDLYIQFQFYHYRNNRSSQEKGSPVGVIHDVVQKIGARPVEDQEMLKISELNFLKITYRNVAFHGVKNLCDCIGQS